MESRNDNFKSEVDIIVKGNGLTIRGSNSYIVIGGMILVGLYLMPTVLDSLSNLILTIKG